MVSKTKFVIENRVCYKGTEFEEVKRCAITEDGEQHIIQTTQEGLEYFSIDNPYHKDNYRDRMFHGKIGDAVQAVLDGYADVIMGGSQESVFTKYAYPIVLINRKVGTEYREKCIEGFKDSKVGYSIFYGGKNSFGGYVVTDERGDWAWAAGTDPKIYESEEEAKEALDKYLDAATELAKSAIDENNIFIGGKIENRNIPGIIREIAWDMLIEIADNKVRLEENLKKLPNIGFDIEQVLY